MFAGKFPPGDRERHHVLKLIAKTVRATDLIKSGSSPNAAGKRLIEQPAIEKHIHAPIGRSNLNGAENVIPVPL